MLNNYINFIKDTETDKRDRYGISLTIERKYNKTANPAASTKDFYDASKDPSVPAYLYDTEDIIFNAVVTYVTEDDIELLKSGEVEIGDAMLDIAIERKELIEATITDKYIITFESKEYTIVDFKSHTLQTLLVAHCTRRK